jgi:hypothetical protein
MTKAIPTYRSLFPSRDMTRNIIKAIGYFAANEKLGGLFMEIKQSFGF